MRSIRIGRPSPAMIVAVIALVAALTGSAVAAGKLKLGALTSGAKAKTVGVGKLTYVSTTQAVPQQNGANVALVATACPAGLRPIGGGAKIINGESGDYITDSYLTAGGYSAHFDINTAAGRTVTVTAACASSLGVTGAPPLS